MKNFTILFLSGILVLALAGCGGDSDEATISTEFDGDYNGSVIESTTIVGIYTMSITDGNISGKFYGGLGITNFSGVVTTGGNANFDVALPDGTLVSVIMMFDTGDVNGIWEDSDGLTGFIDGFESITDFDGTYSGEVSAFSQVIGTYSVTIENGFLTGTYEEDFETTAIYGYVNGTGNIQFNIVFSDGNIVTGLATISGSTITGNFNNTDGTFGTISGGGTSAEGCPEYVFDIDGNQYSTVLIGNQCWTAQNLRVTKLRDGSSIQTSLSGTTWENTSSPAYATYPVSNYVGNYGYLYNWYAVNDSRGLCPQGWHVPTTAEATELVDFVGGGGKLKQTGTLENSDGLFHSPNTGATDEYGFTAVPGGMRKRKINVGIPHEDGAYQDINYIGAYWSSTEANSNSAYLAFLFYADSEGGGQLGLDKNDGYSCRCIKD